MSTNDDIHILVASSNRGRYALDDAAHGRDLTDGDSIELFLGGRWIAGRVKHSHHGPDAPGRYHISSAGDKSNARAGTFSEATFAERVRTEAQKGVSLTDALDAVTGKVNDLFTGYYFVADDGMVCGLCTGMQVRLLT